MYFECNLPKTAALWMNPSVSCLFIDTMNTIRRRMTVLEDAKDLCASAMAPEVFAENAAEVFKKMQQEGRDFDALTPEMLRTAVTYEYEFYGKGKYIAPRMEWPNAEAVVDCRFISTHEWEAVRHIGIGGSDAAVVMGLSPYRTQSELYHDKIGTPSAAQESDSNSVFVRGHFLEDTVIKTFCTLTGAKRIPEYRMFRSKKYPCVVANIDAIVELNGDIFVFEAKTTIADNFMAWISGKVPPHYIPQMRQYPAVLDDERIKGTYIGVLMTRDYEIGNTYMGSTFDLSEFKSRFLNRDIEAENDQLEAESDWWSSYVENNTTPPHIGKMDNELQALNAMATTVSKSSEVVHLAPEMAPFAQEWLALSEESSKLDKQKKALDEQRKALSLPLIEALGPQMATGIIKVGDATYEVKNTPRKGTEYKRDVMELLIDTLQGTNPDMADKLRDCIVDMPCKSRTFTIKKSKTA